MTGFWNGTTTTASSGETIEIMIDDPSKANTTIQVTVQRSDDQTDVVDIALDGSGKGSASYTVPAVLSLELQASGQASHVISVSG